MAPSSVRAPSVSVVIPARNAAKTIAWTLDAIAGQWFAAPFNVVVVDDGSTDATAEVARARGAVVVAGPGRGAGAARNRGVSEARAEIVAFTDADCAPREDWLVAMLRALSEADVVQGRVEAPPGAPIGPYDRTLWVTRPWGLYESANLAVRREAFVAVGGFGRGLESPGSAPFGEDTLFGWRAQRAGARVTFAPDAVVRHAVVARGAHGYVAERKRAGRFAPLVREVPELRETFLHRRWFLSPRSAEFAGAVAGLVTAALTGRPAVVAAMVPYCRRVYADTRRGRRVAVAGILADATSARACAAGSVAARRLVV